MDIALYEHVNWYPVDGLVRLLALLDTGVNVKIAIVITAPKFPDESVVESTRFAREFFDK